MAEVFIHDGIVSIDRPGWSSYIPKECILIAFCVSYNFPLVLSRHSIQ